MDVAEQHLLFDRWLAEHAAVLHHVANGFAEGSDRHDLMQELLLALWRAVPAYRGGARPSTFIYRVAHNTARRCSCYRSWPISFAPSARRGTKSWCPSWFSGR